MTLSIRREAGISFGINAALSLIFFVAVFGLKMRALTWGVPDALALDFVPALIARKRFAMVIGLRTIMLRAITFALAGALLGGLIAFLAGSAAFAPVQLPFALALKLIYGGSLGALITSLTLQRMTR